MSERQDLEGLLRSHLAATADSTPSRRQLDALMERTSATAQRPGWTAVLSSDGRAALGQDARTSIRLGLLLTAVLVLLALLAIGLLAGARTRLAINPAPDASQPAIVVLRSPRPASPSPSPSLPSTARPGDQPACTEFADLAARLGASTGLAWGASTPSPTTAAVRAGKIASWIDNGDGTSSVDLVDPATGAHQALVPFGVPLPRYQGMSWSPDGSALAIGFTGTCSSAVFVWTSHGITLLDPGPGITLNSTAGLAWSPDSTRLTVVPNSATNLGIHAWLLPRDGSPRVELGPPCPTCNGGGGWSPDGTRLGGLYQDTSGSAMGIAIADPSTGTWTLIPEPDGGFSTLGWVRDHVFLTDAITSAGGREELVEYDGDHGTRHVLPIKPHGALLLLPDRRHVLEEVSQGTGANVRMSLEALDLDAGTRRAIWTGPRGIQLDPGAAILAPDGSALAMHGGRWDAAQPTDTWVIRLDGSGATKLTGTDIAQGAWQPLVP